MESGIRAYVEAVQNGDFPAKEHTFGMKQSQFDEFSSVVTAHPTLARACIDHGNCGCCICDGCTITIGTRHTDTCLRMALLSSWTLVAGGDTRIIAGQGTHRSTRRFKTGW